MVATTVLIMAAITSLLVHRQTDSRRAQVVSGVMRLAQWVRRQARQRAQVVAVVTRPDQRAHRQARRLAQVVTVEM